VATPTLLSLRRAYLAGQRASSNSSDNPDSDDPARDAWARYRSRPRKTVITSDHEHAFLDGWSNFDDDNSDVTERYFPPDSPTAAHG
jgi:hypothetical protein